MSSLQSLLNPVSSNPPSPVALVGMRRDTTLSPPPPPLGPSPFSASTSGPRSHARPYNTERRYSDEWMDDDAERRGSEMHSSSPMAAGTQGQPKRPRVVSGGYSISSILSPETPKRVASPPPVQVQSVSLSPLTQRPTASPVVDSVSPPPATSMRRSTISSLLSPEPPPISATPTSRSAEPTGAPRRNPSFGAGDTPSERTGMGSADWSSKVVSPVFGQTSPSESESSSSAGHEAGMRSRALSTEMNMDAVVDGIEDMASSEEDVQMDEPLDSTMQATTRDHPVTYHQETQEEEEAEISESTDSAATETEGHTPVALSTEHSTHSAAVPGPLPHDNDGDEDMLEAAAAESSALPNGHSCISFTPSPPHSPMWQPQEAPPPVAGDFIPTAGDFVPAVGEFMVPRARPQPGAMTIAPLPPLPPKTKKRAAPPKKRGVAASKTQKKKGKTPAGMPYSGDFVSDQEDDSIMVPEVKKKGGRPRGKKQPAVNGHTPKSEGALNGATKRKRAKSPSKKRSANGEELFCICRKPDSGKWMIGCDGCEDWFHGECIHISESDGELIDKYYCPRCTNEDHDTQTTWRRKCRMPSCRRPADVRKNPPSKFCTDSHGVEFFSKQTLRSTLTAPQLATIVHAVPNVHEFHRLGERIPTPPPSSDTEDEFDPGELVRLAEIATERARLDSHKDPIQKRVTYLALALERRKRVWEELKADPETAAATGKDICGYDEVFSLEELEWEEFCKSDTGRAVFAAGTLYGRDGVCTKKKCKNHPMWIRVLGEEYTIQERTREERLAALRSEEKRIMERRKRRKLRDEREGTVDVMT